MLQNFHPQFLLYSLISQTAEVKGT